LWPHWSELPEIGEIQQKDASGPWKKQSIGLVTQGQVKQTKWKPICIFKKKKKPPQSPEDIQCSQENLIRIILGEGTFFFLWMWLVSLWPGILATTIFHYHCNY